MLILGDERERVIHGLQLSTAMQALARGRGPVLHEELEYCCRPLAYSLEKESFCPRGLDVVPLWEGHSSITGVVLRDGCALFVRYEVEEIERVIELGSTEFDVWVALFRRDIDQDYAQDVADALHLADFARIYATAYAE